MAKIGNALLNLFLAAVTHG